MLFIYFTASTIKHTFFLSFRFNGFHTTISNSNRQNDVINLNHKIKYNNRKKDTNLNTFGFFPVCFPPRQINFFSARSHKNNLPAKEFTHLTVTGVWT